MRVLVDTERLRGATTISILPYSSHAHVSPEEALVLKLARVLRAVRRVNVAALGLALFAPLPRAHAQGDPEVLSNGTVVQMVAGKLSKDLIVGKINAARPGFDLSSEGIISLVGYKVDQNIIKLMLQVADNARRSGTAPGTLVGLDEVLSNEIIVRMMNSKVPKSLVLSKIQMSRSAFDVSASGLVSLTTSKVPEDVIKAMMLPPAPPVVAAPVREPAPATSAPPDSKPPAPKATAKPATTTPVKTPATKPPPPPKKPPARDTLAVA